jgi:hypothetical protein
MTKRTITPPINDEVLENKLVSLAFKQAQSQMEDGTASSQIVTHFLRLGSIKAKIELEKLELENRLLEEKIQAEQSGQKLNEMFGEVLAALKSYSYAPPGDSNENLF